MPWRVKAPPDLHQRKARVRVCDGAPAVGTMGAGHARVHQCHGTHGVPAAVVCAPTLINCSAPGEASQAGEVCAYTYPKIHGLGRWRSADRRVLWHSAGATMAESAESMDTESLEHDWIALLQQTNNPVWRLPRSNPTQRTRSIRASGCFPIRASRSVPI